MYLHGKVQSDGVRLRTLDVSDAGRSVAWLSDPEVTRFLTARKVPTLEEELRWIRAMRRSKTDLVCAIEVLEENGAWQHVGNVGLHHIDWHSLHGELGIFIGALAIHNRGVGRKAFRLLRDYALGTLDLFKVYARVYEPNLASQRMCEHAGLVLETVEKRHVLCNGARHDVLTFVAFREE